MSETLETTGPARPKPQSYTGWDGLVVVCASVNWCGVKLAERYLAEQLATHAPVLYVDPPTSHLTRFNKPSVAPALSRPRLRIVAPGLAQYTPLVAPKPMHPAMMPATSWLVRRELAGVVRRLGGRVHAVVSTWLFLDAYGVCDERRRVYWWTDDPVEAAPLWGKSAERLARGDRRLAQSSDLVVAVSEEAVGSFQSRGIAAAHLPNGCDAAALSRVDDADDPTDVQLPSPIAGFVGHFNDRTDLSLLEAVANTGTSLLLIGPKDPAFEPDRFERLAGRPNVSYLGAKPFEQLHSYLKVIDVGLVPYADTPFNRKSFPMKTLECLAAGRPVVATSQPAMRWLGTDLVTLADTPDAFAAATLRQLPHARDPELVARRREFASRHSWADRAERLADLLGLPSQRGRGEDG